MMCCWQIPKLFAAVIGGSPALTGGDLVATAAVVGGAALAVGGAAVAGVGALAGRRRQCGSGYRICGERWRRGLQHDNCGCERRIGRIGFVCRRRLGVAAFVAVARFHREWRRSAQTAGPAIKWLRRWWRGRSANRHDHSRVEIRRAARTYRAEAQPRRRLHRFRQRCRRLGVSRWQVPGSRRNRLSGVSRRRRSTRAMEPLHRDRLPSSPSTVRSGTSGDAVANGPVGASAPPELSQSRQFWGCVGCRIRGKRWSRKSATAHYGERKERAHSRCRSSQGLSASARIVTLGRRATRHATKNSNRARGVTGGHHESFPQTRSTQSRSFRCA